MIYNDKYACDDFEECPGCRPDEVCINCGNHWNRHANWGCDEYLYFSETFEHNRYLTQSMIDSISPNTTVKQMKMSEVNHSDMYGYPKITNPKDISDWRNWAHNVSGECPCGIVRSICEYHR